MKLLAILFEDSKDLSAFVSGMEVIVASADSSVIVAGGSIFAEARLPNPEVLPHEHETVGKTGPPVTTEE